MNLYGSRLLALGNLHFVLLESVEVDVLALFAGESDEVVLFSGHVVESGKLK